MTTFAAITPCRRAVGLWLLAVAALIVAMVAARTAAISLPPW